MKVLSGYEKARLYIESHSQSSYEAEHKKKILTAGPVITISRQTGIGALRICSELVKFFEKHPAHEANGWTYFDRELIDKVIEDHKLPDRFKKFITDTKSRTLDSVFGELLGMHPSKVFLLRKTSKTILRLAEYGNVIIVGRGANLITAHLPKSFHIRLIAPLSKRIENAQILYGSSKKEAQIFIKKEDKARQKYIRTYFHRDIDDPLLYHLLINTGLLDFKEIAEIIGNIVIRKFEKNF